MSRVPLTQAAEMCGVKPATIRRWVHDGHITRHWNGYDFNELIDYRDTRNLDALAVRAGCPGFGVSLASTKHACNA
jgi:hypothetical protein